jgi:hypothetical protein
MKKKIEKQPKDMTTEEAMKHLFTPKGHKIIKKDLAKLERSSTKKG